MTREIYFSNNERGHKSYNARYMGFEDVARTFVPNHQFRELVKPESSIIVGPRGCGKTTLLKMLNPRAFVAVRTEKVRDAYDNMNFWGVYIPADIQWSTLLNKVKAIEPKLEQTNQFVDTLISINVLSSICGCFKSLIELSITQLNGDNPYRETLSVSQIRTIEMDLSQDLIKIWRISDDVAPTLYGILQYWNAVIANLNMTIRNGEVCDEILSTYNGFLDYAHASFDSFVEHCRFINFCALKNFRWALCFDELELAPEELRTTIYRMLRSTSYQEIIFKTTSSFILNKTNILETDAAEGHDYQDILNWVHDKGSEKKWESFCAEMYSQKIEKEVVKAIGNYDLIKCIEKNNELSGRYDKDADYKPGSFTYQLYIELAKKDESFLSFLKEKGIDPKNPYDDDEVKYNLLKKIKTMAICRYYFLKTRTMAPFYFGKEILYGFSEGNPRLAISIMNRMISSYVENGALDIRTQSSVFYDLAEDKMKFYDHYPNTEIVISSSKVYTLGDILKKIGNYFHANLYDDPFSEVAKNAFYIDSQLPTQIVDLINTGIELGAIIRVDSTELDCPVYKLAYILYPFFSLPKRLTTTKAEKLSLILSSMANALINKDQLKIQFSDDN